LKQFVNSTTDVGFKTLKVRMTFNASLLHSQGFLKLKTPGRIGGPVSGWQQTEVNRLRWFADYLGEMRPSFREAGGFG